MTTIAVMVLWSNQTNAAAGAGMLAFAQNCVDSANAVYANSGITARLQLVHSGPVWYDESGDYTTDLNWITSNQAVADLRTTYGADLVSMIVENGQYCGMAWIGPNAGTAFSVVNRGCAVGNYSFTHELGHNMGARHDPANDPTQWPFPYGHGYNRNVVGLGDRDVMAYPPGTRLPYLANPNITVGGAPMGDAVTSNVARVFAENAELVASFKADADPVYSTKVVRSGAAFAVQRIANGAVVDSYDASSVLVSH